MRANWYEAAVGGHSKSISRLIAEGADVDSLDRYGQTALMLAALRGREDVVRVLLANGADMNMTAKYRLSALMLAEINRREDIARMLVDAGADLSIRGSGAPGFAGKTAQAWQRMQAWANSLPISPELTTDAPQAVMMICPDWISIKPERSMEISLDIAGRTR